MECKKRIIIWSTSVIDLIEGKPIGGISVQMYFWAQTFAEKDWDVYSFTERHRKKFVKEKITFLPKRNIKRVNLFSEWWYAFHFISQLKPDLIIYRGANRELLPIVRMSNLFGIKLLFFSASDVNFEPGKELVGSELNRTFYHMAIRQCEFFVVQNVHQQDTLKQNYGKRCIQQYNIWRNDSISNEQIHSSDIVWVANFRRLKRAEWVLDAAERLVNYKFALAGGAVGDKSYYNDMKNRAESMQNVEFLGGRSFSYTCKLVGRSRVLLCTSVFEGFPNTFLQAWSNGLPVISTVDPSGIIKTNGLGEVVENEDELVIAIKRILGNNEYYQQLQRNVNVFYKANYSSEVAFNRLMQNLSGVE